MRDAYRQVPPFDLKKDNKKLNKTNECKSSTGIDFEFEIFENDCLGSVGIGEMDITEFKLPFEIGL
jgi:hypothetical protein